VDVRLSAWVASFLSIVLTARLTPKAISRATEDLSGPPRPDQERLSRLIDRLTDGATLIRICLASAAVRRTASCED